MSSRRDFIRALPILGAGAVFAQGETAANDAALQLLLSRAERLPLVKGWEFRLDRPGTATATELEKSAEGWEAVTVPHTWQTLGREPEYVGVAWYRTKIAAPREWSDRFVRVEFEAVFHSAQVFLNGQKVGEHIGKGYTAFQCDLSPALRCGQTNVLLVRVDNSFSKTMLPRMESFDWTNDGGIIRPVCLLVTPQVFIERLEIDAVPNLEKKIAQVAVRAVVRNTRTEEQTIRLAGRVQREGAEQNQIVISEQTVRLAARTKQSVVLDAVTIDSPELWHFDAPNLYEAEIALESGNDRRTLRELFGIRRFEARGTEFYLNGERVRLMGVERMAGSHPEFGMAEPGEWIAANHGDIKELNCVFTRVHWPQDRRVLEYCDRNGILMQEEVPAWGPMTFSKIDADLLVQLTVNGLEQLREMMASDRNHPCIVSWGLCNEVDGKNPNSQEFAHAMAKEARATDPARLLTYASHSLREHPEEDMAGDFDFISTNEYFGSWYPGGPAELRAHLEELRRVFPNKPIVVSEYGWCECQAKIPPGDGNRVKIVDEHTEVMRESGIVAGAIYFDYNDYRTIVGDHGTGALRQRVHGVVDVYSTRKPSFDALCKQASPVETVALTRTGDGFELEIATRNQFPAYVLRGYVARWLFYGYDDLPMDGRIDRLPDLKPGSRITLKASPAQAGLRRVAVEILRPTGFAAAATELTVQ
jgi:Glycosyl hydrolases family 2, TIM barrel domain/Glycosyl hydrolases family 2, sugar binding domain/Glycosyl hydrolases family 2